MSEQEQAAPSQADETRVPPYVSFKTLCTLMLELGEHGIPNRIDSSILSRFSGSTRNHLMAALRWLELVDRNMRPQPALNSLVDAYETPGWPAALGSLLKDKYRFAIDLDLSKATPGEFADAFRQFSTKDAVASKCKRFFLQAAQASDIEVNQRLLQRKPQRASRQREARPKAEAAPSPSRPPDSGAAPTVVRSQYDLLIDILDTAEMSDEEQQAVWTLIRYLKAREDD